MKDGNSLQGTPHAHQVEGRPGQEVWGLTKVAKQHT